MFDCLLILSFKIGMETFLQNNSLVKECPNETKAIECYETFFNLINLGSNLTSKCLNPCQQINYKMITNLYPINALIDPGKSLEFDPFVGKGVIIFFSFVNNLVEEKKETLIYDFPNFLAAGILQRHDQFDYLKIMYFNVVFSLE